MECTPIISKLLYSTIILFLALSQTVLEAKPHEQQNPSQNYSSIKTIKDNITFCRNNQVIRVPVNSKNVGVIPCWSTIQRFRDGLGILLYKGFNDTNLTLISGNPTEQHKILKYIRKSGFLYNFTDDLSDSVSLYTCYFAISSRRNYVTVEVYRDDKTVHVSSSDCNVSYYKNNWGTFLCRVEGNGRNVKFDWVFKTDGGEDRDVKEHLIEDPKQGVADGVLWEKIRLKLPQSNIHGVGCRIRSSDSCEALEGVQPVNFIDVNPPILLNSTQTGRELTCTFLVDDPSQVIVEWLKDGKPFHEDNILVSYKPGLVITTLTGFTSAKNVNSYGCVARNEGEPRFCSSSSIVVYILNYLVHVYVSSAMITGIIGVWSARWMIQLNRMITCLKRVMKLKKSSALESKKKWKKITPGAQSVVYTAKTKKDKKKRVLKTFASTSKSTSKLTKFLLEDLNNEIKIYEKLNKASENDGRRYIVQYEGYHIENLLKLEVYLVLEVCEQGQLEEFLRDKKDEFLKHINIENKTVEEKEQEERERLRTLLILRKWAVQIAKGMVFLHEQNIVHRDLASRNILLKESNNDVIVQIADFGMSRDLVGSQSYIMTKNTPKEPLIPFPLYPPESIGSKKDKVEFTKKSDVWSFGVLLWEMFSLGTSPAKGYKTEPSDYKDFKEALEKGERLQREDLQPISDDMWTLINDCWELEPNERPDFSVILQRLQVMSSQHEVTKEQRVLLPAVQIGSVLFDPNYQGGEL